MDPELRRTPDGPSQASREEAAWMLYVYLASPYALRRRGRGHSGFPTCSRCGASSEKISATDFAQRNTGATREIETAVPSLDAPPSNSRVHLIRTALPEEACFVPGGRLCSPLRTTDVKRRVRR